MCVKTLRILFLCCFVPVLFSCESNSELKKTLIQKVWLADSLENTHSEQITWKDSLGFIHWKMIDKKSPVLLKFTDKLVILEIPNLKNTVAISPLLHQRSTNIKDTTHFTFEYEINDEDSIITLNIDSWKSVDLKYHKNKLYWPLRASLKYDTIKQKFKDTIVFQVK